METIGIHAAESSRLRTLIASASVKLVFTVGVPRSDRKFAAIRTAFFDELEFKAAAHGYGRHAQQWALPRALTTFRIACGPAVGASQTAPDCS